ncbi:MAG: hypothetical protein ABIH56_06625 [Candidatus Margulisiibacteriota bacterium]
MDRQFPPLFDPTNNSPNYLLWRSIVLAFFENFKFNYVSLGALPRPESADEVHPTQILESLPYYQPRDYYFGEKNHVHFNEFMAYGLPLTDYPMDGLTAPHHFTLEQYTFIWRTPLLSISNWDETFPLIFSTEHNFFLESCNATFLADPEYLREQKYPILVPEHGKYFTKKFFEDHGLPLSLLRQNFALPGLNFCLKIFQESVLIMGGLTEIFGPSKDGRIDFLLKHWDYPNGKNLAGLSPYRLNILAFLYLSLHPAATVLCYGLYRNKYGLATDKRSAFYVRTDRGLIALKDYLKELVNAYIAEINASLKSGADQEEARELISAALDLARMFGVGYKTEDKKGENPHINAPVDFTPIDLNPALKEINFVVEHAPTSPLWRIFYDFCGEWWNKEEIDQVLSGKGPHWERLKKQPRSVAVRTFNKLAAVFWRENIGRLKLAPKTLSAIKETCRNILDQ